MRHIIIISELQLWSMKNKSGAPSFYNTVKAYVDEGWDTHLVYPDNGIEGNIVELKEYRVSVPYEKYLNINKFSFLIKEYRYYYMTQSFVKIAEKILEQIEDPANTVIYAYEIAAVKAGKILAKRHHLKLVTRFQGTILSNENKIFFQKFRLHTHYSALSEPADLVIMTNDGTKGDRVLKELGNNSKTLFLLNGLDRVREEELFFDDVIPGVELGDKVFLTVSRLVNWKRVDRAICAIKEVVQIKKQVKLVIVGDGSAKESLETLVRENTLEKYVIFTGAQPHEKIYSYMKRADVFLSLYDLSNMGNPLFEAMRCGLPIITTDVGDTGSVIVDGENGILLDHNNLNNIAEKMIYLLDSPDYARNIGKNAQKYADEHFMTWKERMNFEVEEVKKLLEEKIDKK